MCNWIIDSGATDHISSSLTNFISYKEIQPIVVNLPNGTKVTATCAGTVKFHTNFILKDVLYIPNFAYNLISIYRLISDLKCKIEFASNFCLIQDQKTAEKIGIARCSDGLYVLDSHNVGVNIVVPSNTVCKNNLWHIRFGHLFANRLSVMKDKHCYIQYKNFDDCAVCHMAKQKKLPFPNSFSHADRSFDLIHVDIWGPCSYSSLDGDRYFLTIVDDCTRFTWIYLMKNKAETRVHLVNFVAYIKTQFSKTIKIIRSDNGPEFNMINFFNTEGIVHQTSCVETPEQNGIVERKHQHILNVTRALIFQANIPMSFWNYAVIYAVFLINHIPTPISK